MNNPVNVSGAFSRSDNKTLTFETGVLAPLASGSVTAQIGDTLVLVTATAAKAPREGADFFPLTVDVEERMYAAGKIPGSFFRREARAGEQAILTCRLIDRPLRPAFPDGFRNEVHVVATVLGADQVNPYDMAALNAASMALCMSSIPFEGPIGAVRLAWTGNGEWVAYPTYQESENAAFEMVVAGRLADDDVAVMMVEAAGTANTWDAYDAGTPKMDEELLAGGLEIAKTSIREAIALQQEMLDALGPVEKMETELLSDYSDEIHQAVIDTAQDQIAATQTIADKAERQEAESELTASIVEQLQERFDEENVTTQIKAAIRSVTKAVVRRRIVTEGLRIDGRKTDQLRNLSAQIGIIPTAHGSGLFQRGETQVLNVTTLGLNRTDQMIDDLSPTDKKRYMHHYNFPPFSTGETGFMRGPKRREIGHGALAERALVPVIPAFEDWPYTVRTVSEALSSNGSTSMASVCGSTLSLMDAGVPIKAPVAGVAMGLVHAEGSYVTLTDILGAEDAYGDMDFKVAGTSDFITALQLDTKISGIPAQVLADALLQARDARMQILEVMTQAIDAPRAEVRDTAPKVCKFEIPMDKIGDVIGPKGKVINTIQAETGAEISVDDDGSVGIVFISSVDSTNVDEAERQVKLILDPPSAEIGATYEGRVVSITKFGAFVNILPGRDGLVHISKLGRGQRIDRVEDVVELGSEIEVVVDDIDPNGKISLLPVGYEPRENARGNRDNARGDNRGGRSNDRGNDDRPRNRDRDNRARDNHDRDNRDRDNRNRNGRSERRDDRRDNRDRRDGQQSNSRNAVSFEESFDEELRQEFGNLGPESRSRRRY